MTSKEMKQKIKSMLEKQGFVFLTQKKLLVGCVTIDTKYRICKCAVGWKLYAKNISIFFDDVEE